MIVNEEEKEMLIEEQQNDESLTDCRIWALVSHAPDSLGKESGNFNHVSVCWKNAI